MRNQNNTYGITLISLVITIIILLILSGVAVSLAMNSDGLFGRAGDAANKWNTSVATEGETVTDLMNTLGTIGKEERNKPNAPKLAEGMTPIKFELPEYDEEAGIDKVGSVVETTASDRDWYNYEEGRWANAKTEDGSMWVWIPRYAYQIDETTQTTKVVFLSGTGDTYYDAEDTPHTAKRATTETDVIDTTEGFTVHPAFTDESSINYRNGGWNEELE